MKTLPENSSLNDEYYVDVILDKRIINNHVEYYVKWTGFTDDYNTWEPHENLYCDNLVEEFEKKKKDTLFYPTDTMEEVQDETGPFNNHIKIACLTEQKSDSINKTNKLIASDLAVKKVIDVVHDSNGQIIKQKYVKEKNKKAKKAKVLRPKIVKKVHKNKITLNEPEKIIGSLTLNGHLMTLLKWKNVDEPDLIPTKEVNVKWPQLIIQFYEKHLLWSNRHNL